MHPALFAFLMLAAADHTGPAVGKPVPAFNLADQTGAERSLKSILGPKGALLVFYRSADW
jgi:peroxiredoxin